MTVLVTGATGNIGRHVVRLLAEHGQPVRAMTRDPHTAKFPTGVEVVSGDFQDPGSWSATLSDVDRVYLFPFAYLGGDAGFTEAAALAGVRRFVVHSAAAAAFPADDDPDDPTIGALRRHLAHERRAHRGIELAAERTGAEWTHVRPGLLAVNALGWAPRIRAERRVREPFGNAGHAVVHEVDIAEIAVAALETDDHIGRAYTITGPARISQREQTRAIADAIGAPVEFHELTEQQTRTQWLADGCPPEYLDWRYELLAATRHRDEFVPPTDTFRHITGRPPRTFAQWARDHAADFR